MKEHISSEDSGVGLGRALLVVAVVSLDEVDSDITADRRCMHGRRSRFFSELLAWRTDKF